MQVAPRAEPVLAISTVFVCIAFLCVSLRVWTRAFIIGNFGVDDGLMIGAMMASIGFFIVELHQIKYGLGLHIADVPLEDQMRFFQCLWATIPVYNLSLLFCKLSIIFQYRRVFDIPVIQKLCRYLLIFMALYGCWTVLGSVFMCVPVQFFWGVGEGHCMDKLAFWFSNAALNITTDIFIFAIPMPLLKNLKLPLRQKVILMVVFALGAFVCITSIIRLKSLLEISVTTDTTFDGVEIAIWSNVEINIAMICACVPVLKPLVSKIFPKLLGSIQSRSHGFKSGGIASAGGSHHMQSLGSRSAPHKPCEIHVQHTVKVTSEEGFDRSVREGSERNLFVAWNDDDYPSETLRERSKGREMV